MPSPSHPWSIQSISQTRRRTWLQSVFWQDNRMVAKKVVSMRPSKAIGLVEVAPCSMPASSKEVSTVWTSLTPIWILALSHRIQTTTSSCRALALLQPISSNSRTICLLSSSFIWLWLAISTTRALSCASLPIGLLSKMKSQIVEATNYIKWRSHRQT